VQLDTVLIHVKDGTVSSNESRGRTFLVKNFPRIDIISTHRYIQYVYFLSTYITTINCYFLIRFISRSYLFGFGSLVLGFSKKCSTLNSDGSRVELEHSANILQWVLLLTSSDTATFWSSAGSLDFF